MEKQTKVHIRGTMMNVYCQMYRRANNMKYVYNAELCLVREQGKAKKNSFSAFKMTNDNTIDDKR